VQLVRTDNVEVSVDLTSMTADRDIRGIGEHGLVRRTALPSGERVVLVHRPDPFHWVTQKVDEPNIWNNGVDSARYAGKSGSLILDVPTSGWGAKTINKLVALAFIAPINMKAARREFCLRPDAEPSGRARTSPS